jgi:hypothetical protein
MTTIVSNDLARMITVFTEDINISVGKAEGAIGFLITASTMLGVSGGFILSRIRGAAETEVKKIEPGREIIVSRGGRSKKMAKSNKSKTRRNKKKT